MKSTFQRITPLGWCWLVSAVALYVLGLRSGEGVTFFAAAFYALLFLVDLHRAHRHAKRERAEHERAQRRFSFKAMPRATLRFSHPDFTESSAVRTVRCVTCSNHWWIEHAEIERPGFCAYCGTKFNHYQTVSPDEFAKGNDR